MRLDNASGNARRILPERDLPAPDIAFLGAALSYTFTKLFSGLTESTVWVEPYATRVLWVSMLSWADQHGRVFGSIPGIARRAGITREECESALASFLSPDRDSRTPDNEGRRIETMDGGWRLLNYAKYRELRDIAVRREQNREAQRRHRERVSNNVSNDADSKQNKPPSAQAEAEAEADKDLKDERLPALVVVADDAKHPRCDFQAILDCFHRRLPMLPRVNVISNPRKKSMQARWREICIEDKCKTTDEAIAVFDWYFELASRSAFLTGKSTDWRASFDWLIGPKNFYKVVDRNYHGKKEIA